MKKGSIQVIDEDFNQFFRLFNLFPAKSSSDVVFLLNGVEKHITPRIKMLDEFQFYMKEIATGGSKRACQFNEIVCLLPNSDIERAPNVWKRMMDEEKMASDEIFAKTGIRTQDFSIQSLALQHPGTQKWASIPVLVAKGFHQLAVDENIRVMDNKNTLFYGKEISLYQSKIDNLNNVDWNRQLFQSLLNEIVKAHSFGVRYTGDAQNYYLKPPHADDELPQFHLFLYDFSSKHCHFNFPIIFETLKLPLRSQIKKQFTDAVSNAVYMISEVEKRALGYQGGIVISPIYTHLEGKFLNHIVIEAMLDEAYRKLGPIPFSFTNLMVKLKNSFNKHYSLLTNKWVNAKLNLLVWAFSFTPYQSIAFNAPSCVISQTVINEDNEPKISAVESNVEFISNERENINNRECRMRGNSF